MQSTNQPSDLNGKLHIMFPIITIAISGLFFIVALALPVYKFANGEYYSGLMVLLFGWMGPFGVVAGNTIGWYANLFLFFAWIALALAKFRPMPFFAVIALSIGIVIALTSLGVSRLATNEAGTMDEVTIGLGFYMWLASFGVALLGSLVKIVLPLLAPET